MINFNDKRLLYRCSSKATPELLLKALGVKRNAEFASLGYKILDLTAGLGQDSYVLARAGCVVTMLERSNAVAALLEDALKHLKKDPEYCALPLGLIHIDSEAYLHKLLQSEDRSNFPDAVYIDPMFPEKRKTALPKKEMRILRELVGDDTDSDALLPLALQVAKKRVVVKRPRLAPFLNNKKPNFSLTGQSSRFDVYVNIL
ncbi:MAG: class I SAM-dependent methyltransferase [Gammaproteobacteria bacterium]